MRAGFGVGRAIILNRRLFRMEGLFGLNMGLAVRRAVPRRVFNETRLEGTGALGVETRREVGVVGQGFVRSQAQAAGFDTTTGRFVGARK